MAVIVESDLVDRGDREVGWDEGDRPGHEHDRRHDASRGGPADERLVSAFPGHCATRAVTWVRDAAEGTTEIWPVRDEAVMSAP